MAKAASPVRLQRELMDAASLTGKRFHRSAAEQIEYWADIGRSASNILDPDALLSITSGLSRLKLEPVVSPLVEPDAVFLTLESERQSGTLVESITSGTVKTGVGGRALPPTSSKLMSVGCQYQVSIEYPGQLERITTDGQLTVGQFKNGEFIPFDMAES